MALTDLLERDDLPADARAQLAAAQDRLATLEANETRYRLLFNATNEPMALASLRDGTLVDCNPAFCELLGRPASELLGRHHAVLHPPERVPAAPFQSTPATADGGGGQPANLQLLNAAGELLEVEVMRTRVPLGDGSDGWLGFFRDRTREYLRARIGQHLREAVLAVANSRDVAQGVSVLLAAAFEVSGMEARGVHIVEPEAAVVAEWDGVPPVFLEAVRTIPRGHPALVAVARAEHWATLAELGPELAQLCAAVGFQCAYVLPIRIGQELVATLNVASTRLRELDDVRLDALRTLATEAGSVLQRLRVEGEARRQSALLGAVLDAIPDGIFARNVEGACIAYNKACLHLVAPLDHRVPAAPTVEGFSFEETARHRQIDWRVMTLGKTERTEEQVYGPAGTALELEVVKTPFTAADGEVLGLVGVLRDVTERKRSDAVRQARVRLLELAPVLDWEHLVRATVSEAESLTQSAVGLFRLAGDDHGITSPEHSDWRPSTRHWDDCLARGVPVRSDYDTASRELLVPVSRRGEVVAVLAVGRKPSRYDAGDVHAVAELADAAWDIMSWKHASDQLARSEELYRGVFNNAQVGVARVRLGDHRMEIANQRMADILGYEDVPALLAGYECTRHYRDPAANEVFLEQLQSQGYLLHHDMQATRADGRVVWLRQSTRLDRATQKFDAIVADVTAEIEARAARELTERVLRVRSEVRHAILRAGSTDEMLASVCDAAVAAGGFSLVWIGLLDHAPESVIRPAAAAGRNHDYLANVRIRWDDGPLAGGPAGRAARERRPVACEVLTDETFAPWRERALEHGYRSLVALPLLDKRDSCRGVFLLYADAPGQFPPAAVDLLQGLADDVAFGLTALDAAGERDEALRLARQARDDLQRQLAFQKALMDAVPLPVIVNAVEGPVISVNRAAEEQATTLPNSEQVRRAARLASRGVPVRSSGSERLIRHEGRLLAVHRADAVDDEQRVCGICTVLVDLTEQEQTIEELTQVRTQLRVVAEALIAAEDAERRRVAAELHDTLGQTLAVLQISLGTLLARPMADELRVAVGECRTLLSEVIAGARALTRRLSPAPLYELGLEAGLRQLAKEVGRTHELNITVRYAVQTEPLAEPLRLAFYQFTRELLHNVVKHARCTKVEVSVRSARGGLRLVVEDSGAAPAPELLVGPLSALGGFGLFFIRERAERLGGSLTLAHSRLGGLKVTVQVPTGTPAAALEVAS